MSDSEDVIQVYDAWCKAFQSIDVYGMKALFDQDFDGLIYQPAEVPDPMFSWSEISAYWDSIPAIVASIRQWRELERKVVVDRDSAYVYSRTDTHVLVKDAKRPLIGDLRVVLCMHRTARGWALIGVHESRHLDLAGLFTD